MADRSIDRLTLRELATDSERLLREAVEHIELGFAPKVRAVSRLVRLSDESSEEDDVEFLTIRNRVADLLESDTFTERLYEKLDEYFAAIDRSVSKIVS